MYSTVIRAVDGTELAAKVHVPAGAGPHPLLVVPGAWWVMPLDMLADREAALAQAGYVVVSYDPRGLRRSGGGIDMAGPSDVQDASAVVSWALAHTPVDPGRVGMLASSYGAALALNAAAHDGRIRAVAALCPWTDLVGAYLPGGARASTVTTYQEVFGRLNGRLSVDTARAFASMRSGKGLQDTAVWAQRRSPATRTAGLNAHRTAVFLSGEWSDPLVPAGQTGLLLDSLSGPKQLWMNPGGHGDSSSGEAAVLQPDAQVRTHALAWLARFLQHADNGADKLGPVLVRPRTEQAVETYPSWAALDRSRRSVALTPATAAARVRLVAGTPGLADSGLFPVSGLLDEAGLPPATSLALLRPPLAAVWHSTALTAPWAIRGTPRLALTVTPSAKRGLIVAHLYDVDELGVARLLTHQPHAFDRHTPGRPLNISLAFPATAWTVPAGHRIALVLDTADHRYSDPNPIGATFDIDTAHTRLDLPAGR
ncbi:alpha/beta fold hydrolase [Streptomyces cinereoruber]|uniref:alpha/beta fold hydrolase n=1 Tax=Streptomyces cinereoruber TaxID=67260 RepID=UPI00362B3A22